MLHERLSIPFVAMETGEYLGGPAQVAGILYSPGKSMGAHILGEAYVDQTGIRPHEFSPVSDRQFMVTKPNGQMESQRSLPAMARLQIMATDKEGLLLMDGDSLVFGVAKAPEMGVKVHTTDGIVAVDQGDMVANFLSDRFGKELRLVWQVDTKPRRRDEVLPLMEGIDLLLRLQDSSTITALSHANLLVLNHRLKSFDWFMEALSFRMNFLFSGEINEHQAVGKFLQFGPEHRAVYAYVWRPKERCALPAVDQLTGEVRGAEGAPRERLGFVFQEILKESNIHDELGIPPEWRMKLGTGSGSLLPKAMLGVDMFPINKGIVRVGDRIQIVSKLPEKIMNRL